MTEALMPRTREEAEALTLRIWPDPILDMKADEVLPEELPYLHLLVNRMRFIMELSRGIGIAAPQLGVRKKIFLISERVRAPHHVFVNPSLVTLGRLESMREGCLSVPGAFAEISRKVMVRVYDQDGKGVLLTGQAAHVAQHEYEHLQGIIRVAR